MTESQSSINLDYLQELSDGDLEFEKDLLEIYLEDSKLHIEAAKSAIANRDHYTLGREAHHLKGASGNVGAIEMQSLSLELEQKSELQDWQPVNQIIANLEDGLVKVQLFLDSHYA
jgi:histidine phosphotransfer protein HptB